MVCSIDDSKNGKCVLSGNSKVRKWGKIELMESGKQDVKAAAANKRNERNKMLAQIQKYNEETTDKASLPLKMLTLPIFIVLGAACGHQPAPIKDAGIDVTKRVDNKTPRADGVIPPDGATPYLIDDFESRDCRNKVFNNTWVGFNGFENHISCANGYLHAEGSGIYPGFNVIPIDKTLDVSKYRYIELKIRGKVSSPMGTVKIEAFATDKYTDPEGFARFPISESFQTVRVDINDLSKVPYFKKIQVLADGDNSQGAQIDIDDVKLIP